MTYIRVKEISANRQVSNTVFLKIHIYNRIYFFTVDRNKNVTLDFLERNFDDEENSLIYFVSIVRVHITVRLVGVSKAREITNRPSYRDEIIGP